jgi:hypothetical protein
MELVVILFLFAFVLEGRPFVLSQSALRSCVIQFPERVNTFSQLFSFEIVASRMVAAKWMALPVSGNASSTLPLWIG